MGDVILATGWAVFKEFIGWNDVVGCFSQGDLWACGSLLMDAIPWTSIFSKGKKMWRAFEATLSAVKAWRTAKAVAQAGLKAARSAKAALIKAKKAAQEAAAEAKRKAKAAAKAAAAAAKKKSHTGSKGARGNAPQVKARTSAQSKGSSGGGRAEGKSGGSRGGSGRDDSGGDSGGGSDGGSGGGGCPDVDNSFTPGTRVLMADGSTKPIKDVKNGDQVLATDPETGETRMETVTAEIKGQGVKHLVKVTIDTDGDNGTQTAEVTATDGHPFWVPELGEWIDATDIRSGQWLQTGAGTYVQVTAVERWTALQATVHNLTVSDLHTYYVLAGATPVLVHNCSTPNYGELDEHGRATGVEALLTKDSIGGKTNPSVDPAGWESGQGYNRAHLLAAVLGGANNDRRNFVTMHAYANSPVMRAFELQIRNVVRGGENVSYRATPIYSGTSSIPLGVTLSARGNLGFSLDVSIVNRKR
ncbi:DNA/RNA non-specific endonuclease [Streptomyces sp. NPDC002845]